MTITFLSSRSPLLAALALAAGMAAALPAMADSTASGKVTSAAGQGSARFDWLNPNSSSKARPENVSYDAQPGTATTPVSHGSWVCSPAGFGSKSSCRRR